MARLSDLIEAFIKELIMQEEGVIEIQRNELANKFNCVPSQINYVISTRFNHSNGYYVESKRGGGGHIKIKRVDLSENGSYLMHIIASMGDFITQQDAEIFLKNFFDYDVITEREAMLIKSAVSDKALKEIVPVHRDLVRANIFKNMIMSLIL